VSSPDRPLAPSTKRICLVTEEIAGPDFNGGIGTANRGLALALRAEGYQVDVLYTRVDHGQPFCFRGAFADQVRVFRGLGIRLLCIRHDGQWSDWLAKSYRALEHLVHHEYDLVFFNDCRGTAYYPLLSRRTGNPRLAKTIMCIVAHSSTQWIAEINEQLITSIDDLRVIELERRSVELADIVISPSSYLLQRYREYGWNLPKATYVQPNILLQEPRPTSTPTSRRVAVEELVFFGRLETRKGLWIFCNTLERIKYDLVGRTVTFLGKFTNEDGESTGLTVMRRAAAWPFEIRFLHDYDQEQALNYLKSGARLAIMPSLADNSPCVILECLNESIPFIAASGSGGQELLSPKSHRDCLFEPTVDALAEKIRKILNEGALTGLPSFDSDKNEQTFKRWVNSVLTSQVDRSTVRPSGQVDRPVLLAVAPSTLDVRGSLRSLDQILAQFGDVNLILLSDKADVLSSLLDRNGKDGRHKHLQIFDASSYPRALDAISAVGAGPIAVFQLGRAITPEIVARAQICFLENQDLSAVTGHTRGAESDKLDDLPVFTSTGDALPEVQRYLIGNAPSLFVLTQETNDGFAIFRRSALSLLASVPPLDQRYSRLKRVSDWIHELLIELYASGKQFELLPDSVSETVSEEAAFEIPQLCQIMRSYGNSHLGFAPGSPQALLSRLAIDGSRNDDLHRANHECLNYLAEKLGVHPDDWQINPDSDEYLILLSTMAYASGKIDLAFEVV
jgi:glycosyltransferase involved in cell wall biosynthesis